MLIINGNIINHYKGDNNMPEALPGVKPTITDRPIFYFLGSSVTLGSDGDVSFVEYMAESNNWICKKEAVSGTVLADNGADSYVQRMCKNIRADEHMDHLICQLSTNDVWMNIPIGVISSSKKIESFDTSTTTGAMEYIIAYSYQTWNCPITFYTNLYFNNPNYEELITTLYRLQNKWDIGIVDFYYYKDMESLSDDTLASYVFPDKVHPNANGYKWMAQIFSKCLEKYLGSN